jgi:hypothetical protein
MIIVYTFQNRSILLKNLEICYKIDISSSQNKRYASAAGKSPLGNQPNCADISNFNSARQAERHLNSIKAYLENLSFNWEINIFLEWNNGATLEATLARTDGVRGHFDASRLV